MKQRAMLYIILAGVLWGTSGIFVHYLAPLGFTSYQMTATRAIVSFLCILTYVLCRNRSLLRIKPIHLLLFLGLGLSLFLTGSCYFASMQLTSVSTAVVLMYAAPIYVMIFSVLFLHERLTWSKGIAIACMLVGCCLVSGIIGGFTFDVGGILLGFLSGVAYAAYNVLTKICVQKKIHPLTVTLYGFLCMSLISLTVLQPASMAAHISAAPPYAILLLLALGVCTFVLPYLLYTLAIKELSAGTASTLAVVEPMAATLFGVILFDEKLSLLSTVGIVLILLAIFLIGRAEKDGIHKISKKRKGE